MAAIRKVTQKTRRSLHEASPGGRLAELEAARERLAAALADAEQRKMHALAEISNAAEAHGTRDRATLREILKSRTPRPTTAERVLARFGAAAEVKTDGEPDALAQLDAAQAEAAELQPALAKLDEELAQAKVDASLVLIEDLRPEHDALARRMVAAALELQAAHKAYTDKTAEWKAEGIAWGHMGPAFYDFAGDANDPQSSLAFWLRRMITFGHLTRAQMPSELVHNPRPAR